MSGASSEQHFTNRCMQTAQLGHLLTVIDALCQRASTVVRDVYEDGSLAIRTKDDAKDVQTRADRRSERVIVGGLQRHFPGVRVVGEEGELGDVLTERADNSAPQQYDASADWPDALPLNRVTVWVDPLDGTQELIDGFVHRVTILVGIALDDDPIAGVIAQPFVRAAADERRSRTVVGWVGSNTPVEERVFGLYDNVSPTATCADPSERLTIVTSRSHGQAAIDAVQDELRALEADGRRVEWLRAGGCGAKTLEVLEGRAHLYLFPTPGTKKWDSCACDAITKAVGGCFTDIDGRAIQYAFGVDHMNARGLRVSLLAREHLGC